VRDLHAAVERATIPGLTAEVDAVAERARSIATVAVDLTCGAGGARGMVVGAAGEQDVGLVCRTVDLARQPGLAVDLALAVLARQAGRGLAQAVLVAGVAVAAFGRARTPRHTAIVQALKHALAVVVTTTRLTDPGIAAGTSGERDEHQQPGDGAA
jgi:hypothetical protein